MNLTRAMMQNALMALEKHLTKPVQLIVGGGGAMVLAHHFPLQTSDIDAIPAKGTTIEELDPLVKKVAQELHLSPDWLNPYYATFTHVLPSDYANRLATVYKGTTLTVFALSKDDLLIMKCFAGRMKDRQHVRVLIKQGAHIKFVESHIENLKKKNIPNAEKALDFLDEILDLVDFHS